MTDPFIDKIEELVEKSQGHIRADVVHQRLIAMGFTGNERSTRRAVAAAKQAYRDGHRRSYKPWVPEPGLWIQFDWGKGPGAAGRGTQLFCACTGVVSRTCLVGSSRAPDRRRLTSH